jgi:hypothetical protein
MSTLIDPVTIPAALVSRTLDELEVTDTVFHDLAFTMPLTSKLLDLVADRPRTDRVLLVGPNLVLARTLVEQGRDVTLWHVPGVAVSEELRGRVARAGSLDDLFAPGTSDDELDGFETFDVIVLPHVLDATRLEPVEMLSAARRMLAPDGLIVVAVRRAGALGTRLRALAGRSPLPDPVDATVRHSWSWPIGAPRRLVDLDGVRAAARRSGLRIVDATNVVETNPVADVDALPLGRWLAANVSYLTKRAVPALRDTMVATLGPIAFGRPQSSLGTDPSAFPSVTVVVQGDDETRTDRVLGDLDGQTYPRDLIDIVVASPGAGTFDAAAANRAWRAAPNDIVAFTDDWCRLPAGWIEGGVRGLGDYTTALAGGVFADNTSSVPFLGLPGRRLRCGGSGLYLAANSFYVRDALEAVDGFDERAGAQWGWDSTAAGRLAAAGYPVAEDESAFVHRHYEFPPDRSWIRTEYERARGIPMAIRRNPYLRASALHHRYFASERTLAFDVLLAGIGVAVVTRKPLYAVALAVPWARTVAEYVDFWPLPEWRTSARNLRGIGIRNAAWLGGLIEGSVRARRIVL